MDDNDYYHDGYERSDTMAFGPFRLDLTAKQLWHEDRPLNLRPQAAAVLGYLAQRPGQIVTQEELLQQIWRGAAVTPSSLRVTIHQIRSALGDTANTPAYIETVGRQGYRFIASVVPHPLSYSFQAAPGRLRPLVGRESQLEQLRQSRRLASQGTRQLVLVHGEPGIGKTALIEAFVSEIDERPEIRIARGQCIDHLGEGEAYMPVLQMLGQLARASGGDRVVSALRKWAPSWLPHLPGVVSEDERERLQRQNPETTRTRMIRQLHEALEVLSQDIPLVLVLEDLHWSDPSTLDLLSSLVEQTGAARLLVVGTYRPRLPGGEFVPVHTRAWELIGRQLAVDVSLGRLSTDQVGRFIASYLGEVAVPDLVRLLDERTEGNPLFLSNVLTYLVSERALAPSAQGWIWAETDETWEKRLPEALRQLLITYAEQLPGAMLEVLEAASVVGESFVAAAAAAGTSQPEAEVAARCEALAQHGYWLEDQGALTWPDGTLSGVYRFHHGLYRQVLYERLGAERRVRLHLSVGLRLEAAYGQQAQALAATLAHHFIQGQAPSRALWYAQLAAEQALLRSAPQEAILHCRTGLDLVPRLPATPERTQHELNLLLNLRPALVSTKGYNTPEIADVLSRLKALSRHLEEGQQLAAIWGGLVTFHTMRAELPAARQAAQEERRLAASLPEPILRLKAEFNLGTTLYYSGALTDLRDLCETSIRFCDTQPLHTLRTSTGLVNYAVGHRIYLAWGLWRLGYLDQSLARMQEALSLAQHLGDPPNIALAKYFAAVLYRYRRETSAELEQLESLLDLATPHSPLYWQKLGRMQRSVVWVEQGHGINALTQVNREYERSKNRNALGRIGYLSMLAEMHGHIGQIDTGLERLSEALTRLEHTGEYVFEPELYLVRGGLLLQRSAAAHAEAETCFQHALETARRQQAKSRELQAAMSLSRLWRQQGRLDEAWQLLAPIYDWFTEGFDTADLQEAKALLADLSLDSLGTLVFESQSLGDDRAEAAAPLLPPPLPDVRKPGGLSNAITFLQTLLANGPMASTVVLHEAKAVGVSETTLRRAKDRLGVRVAREHRAQGERGRGQWVWYLTKD